MSALANPSHTFAAAQHLHRPVDGHRQSGPRRHDDGHRHRLVGMADNQRIEDLRRRVQKDPASIAFAQLAEECRRAGHLPGGGRRLPRRSRASSRISLRARHAGPRADRAQRSRDGARRTRARPQERAGKSRRDSRRRRNPSSPGLAWPRRWRTTAPRSRWRATIRIWNGPSTSSRARSNRRCRGIGGRPVVRADAGRISAEPAAATGTPAPAAKPRRRRPCGLRPPRRRKRRPSRPRSSRTPSFLNQSRW